MHSWEICRKKPKLDEKIIGLGFMKEKWKSQEKEGETLVGGAS